MSFTKNSPKSLCHLFIMITVIFLTACAGKVKQGEVIVDPELVKTEDQQTEMKKRFERALAHQNSSEYDDAKVIYKSLLAEDEALISPVVNLGVIAVHQAQLSEAKEYFGIVVELDPNHKQSLNYLGYIARESGEFDKAEVYYRRVLEIDQNDELAIRNLGILLDLYRGRLEEALVLYERYQSLQTEPDPKLKDWIFDTKSRLKAK